MRRTILAAALAAAATTAQAHPGHLAEAAGHSHWLGAAAIGAAIALGLWAGLKGRRDAAAGKERQDDADDAANQEA